MSEKEIEILTKGLYLLLLSEQTGKSVEELMKEISQKREEMEREEGGE